MSTFSLNILIVEDDIALAIDLEMTIEEMGYNVVGKVDNSAEALETIHLKNPDLIMMDIDIKGNMNGIEIAQNIRHLNIPVLFITSYNTQEYYDIASNTNHIGYLVKPINKFTLQSTIETTFNRLRSLETNKKSEESEEHTAFPFNGTLFFKKRGILHKIHIHDILYVRADDDYTITVTEHGEFISSLRLFEIEKLLPLLSFSKTHRSYIVNLNKIDAIDPTNSIILIKANKIPISRSNKASIIEKIHLLK